MTDLNLHARSFLYIFPFLSKNSQFRKNPSVNNEHLRTVGHCWENQN